MRARSRKTGLRSALPICPRTVSWFDHPRDLLSLLTNFLPPKRLLSNSGRPSSGRAQIKAQASQLENMGPVWLPPVLQRTAPSEGLHGRRIFGVGEWCAAKTVFSHLLLLSSRFRLSVSPLRLASPPRASVRAGHSFSGAALAMLANAAPNLFEGIVIIDGVINNPATCERPNRRAHGLCVRVCVFSFSFPCRFLLGSCASHPSR